jgi:hypothetical protein
MRALTYRDFGYLVERFHERQTQGHKERVESGEINDSFCEESVYIVVHPFLPHEDSRHPSNFLRPLEQRIL